MSKLKSLLKLFIVMFKIGLFTFGGGYAMIAVIEREFVERKKWLDHDEFMDIVAIAESTPGPLAINTSTYVGYKRNGVLGSVFATLGVVLPSFIIIFIVSFFFDKFLSLAFVKYAFGGIRACVAYLILSAGFKMFKKLKKSAFNLIMTILSLSVFLGLTLFAVNFSSIFFILIGGVVGVTVYLIEIFRKKNKSKEEGK